MVFQVEIHVLPRPGVLDTHGEAVHKALGALGYEGVERVQVGRLIRLELRAQSPEAAWERATAMCKRLLVNSVTEEFQIRVHEQAESGQ